VQVAALLGVRRQRVYEMIERGELPHVRLSERGTRIPAAALDAYLAAQAERAIDAMRRKAAK
jgi:excisionase family DNA binding protein